MPTKDPRVDAYIDEAEPFARPILKRIRRVVHASCPSIVETIKWHMPFFDYQGLLCGMAGFKAHCALVFWRDVKPVASSRRAMGQFGRLASVADLPSDAELKRIVREAVVRREAGSTKKTPAKKKPAKPVVVPADLRRALAGNPKAKAAFAAFSPSHRREYIEWISEAKRPETRARRLTTTLAWLEQGRSRNWQYM